VRLEEYAAGRGRVALEVPDAYLVYGGLVPVADVAAAPNWVECVPVRGKDPGRVADPDRGPLAVLLLPLCMLTVLVPLVYVGRVPLVPFER
jgi:hypothetical protein